MSDRLQPISPIRRFPGRLTALHVRIAPDTHLDGHRHDHATIVMVLDGGLVVREGSREIEEPSGTLRLSSVSTNHSIRTIGGADCLIISCDPSNIVARHAIWPTIPHGKNLRASVAPSVSDVLLERLRTDCAHDGDPEFESLCVQLLCAVHRAGDQRCAPSWLNGALCALAASGGRSGASREVAREIGIHPVHLGRVVREFTGLTVRDYVRHERILRASRSLRSSNETLTELAHRSGFADQSHFTREFVHRFGMTPSRHRNAAGDVVSIQAEDVPAVHVGRVSQSRRPT